MKKVRIVCDGSSVGNGTARARAGAAAVLQYRAGEALHELEVTAALGRATNQQAEIVAAAIGLEALKEPCEVELLSDSRYVIETLAGRFKRKTNFDFWARLDRARAGHDVTPRWVKGHAGDPLQERADRLAREAARS